MQSCASGTNTVADRGDQLPNQNPGRVHLLVTLLLICASSFAVPPAWADTPSVSSNAKANDPTTQTIPPLKAEIVVTPERGPVQRNEVAASVTVLTREQLAALPAQSLDEV